jgi:hypothetical protein
VLFASQENSGMQYGEAKRELMGRKDGRALEIYAADWAKLLMG